MANLKTPAIPHKMYRHFAVVTVLLTATLAMFADGENRELAAASIEQHQRDAELRRISAARVGNARLEISKPSSGGGIDEGGGEFDPSYGKPMIASASGSSVAPAAPRKAVGGPRVAIPGYPAAYINSLSDDEYQQLLASMREAGMMSAQSRQAQAKKFAQASAQRSGTRVGAD